MQIFSVNGFYFLYKYNENHYLFDCNQQSKDLIDINRIIHSVIFEFLVILLERNKKN